MPNAADRIKAQNLIMLRRAARAKLDGRKKGARRLKRPPALLYPLSIERKYKKTLAFVVDEMRRLVSLRVVPELGQLVADAQAARPTADHARVDDYGDAVAKLMSLVRSGFFGVYSDERLKAMATEIANAVAVNNKVQVGKVFKSVLGVDIFQAEPWLTPELMAFVTQNVALIKSLSTTYFDRIEGLVFDGARRGLRWQEIRDNLEAATPASRARAELIARDQVGKFNGQLAMLRQTQAGVSRYRWRGALDARERPEHRAREGEVFAWDTPPSDGHPGEPIQCRCWAEPVLEDVVDGLVDEA